MSFLPDWAPNAHPLIVHFPIGLLVSAAVVDFLSLIMRRRPVLRDAATWLYCAGAAAAIVTYFTGQSAADGMLLDAAVNPAVNEHSDWAFRTTWYFAFFASIRMALSYIIKPPGLALPVVAFVLGLGGVALLVETAEHGGELVFAHGLGVRAVADHVADPPAPVVDENGDPGIIALDAGGWVWQPQEGAVEVLADQFEWIERDSAALSPGVTIDAELGPVLALRPHGAPAMFTGGEPAAGTQVDARVNVDELDGRLTLAFHVQDAATYDFLSVDRTAVRLGRLDDGAETLFETHEGVPEGWLTLRVYGGGGHFRGYVNGELVTHGHAPDLPPGPAGLRLEGTGTALIDQLHIQAVE